MICDDCDTVARCSMCDTCPDPKVRDLTADEQDLLMFPLSRAEQEQLLIELSKDHS